MVTLALGFVGVPILAKRCNMFWFVFVFCGSGGKNWGSTHDLTEFWNTGVPTVGRVRHHLGMSLSSLGTGWVGNPKTSRSFQTQQDLTQLTPVGQHGFCMFLCVFGSL